MDDQRLGTTIRRLRQRKGWTQQQLAAAAKVSQSTESRLERGHLDTLTLRQIRRIAAPLDCRIDLGPRWRAGDLDRLLNARHSALHEDVARSFVARPGWTTAPEVSFSIYGERGVIDLLCWHPARRALLVIELKTDIADVNELLGTLDRKRRLARKIALERGWDPATISVWVIVAAGRTNRRRLEEHRAMIGAALPEDGRRMRSWLRDPIGPIAALSTWPRYPGEPGRGTRAVRRRPTAIASPERAADAFEAR